jgi:hypothetical protein
MTTAARHRRASWHDQRAGAAMARPSELTIWNAGKSCEQHPHAPNFPRKPAFRARFLASITDLSSVGRYVLHCIYMLYIVMSLSCCARSRLVFSSSL